MEARVVAEKTFEVLSPHDALQIFLNVFLLDDYFYAMDNESYRITVYVDD